MNLRGRPTLLAGHADQLNILNVVRYPIGGIRSYLRYTYSRLDPRRYRTTIVTVDRPEAELLPAGLAPLDADLVLVRERGAVWRLIRRVRSLLATGRYDVVHAQGFTAAVVSVIADPAHGTPRIVTLHETLTLERFQHPYGFATRAFLARVLAGMDTVVTVGEDARANLVELLRLPSQTADQIHVIRNGVSVDGVRAEAARELWGIRAQLGIDEGTVLIGFVGRFMPEKGFDLLIDAVELMRRSELPLPRFKVVAVNDGAFEREYRQRVVERRLVDDFVFLGFRSSVAGLIAELDATVMPSRREACPLVAMEAMILGCPLIASDCIGLREVTADAPVLSMRTGHAGSLAEALRTFLQAPTPFKRQAVAYATTAQAEFDSGGTARKLDAVFNGVLARGGRASGKKGDRQVPRLPPGTGDAAIQ